MEIEIDVDLVRRILAGERDQARRELTTLGPLRALEASHRRHDERLAAAADASTLACRDGCCWCCYFTVDVRPVEAFRILDFMEQDLAPLERERAREEILRTSASLRDVSAEDRVRRNIKCSFLSEGRCTIYAVRPQTCRNYHATNVEGCKQSYDEPDNEEIDPEFAPLVYQTGGAHVEGFSAATARAGLDTHAYEMNSALAAAMADPQSRARFLRGEAPFPELEGAEVPPEFDAD